MKAYIKAYRVWMGMCDVGRLHVYLGEQEEESGGFDVVLFDEFL